MDDFAIEIWGAIAPITTEIFWQGSIKTLTFHIPTNEEELSILRRVNTLPQEERVFMEGIIRMAYALSDVDGMRVDEIHPSLDARIEWIKQWPGRLLDVVASAYYLAQEQPFQRLKEMVTDPNIVAALSGNGMGLEQAATSADKS